MARVGASGKRDQEKSGLECTMQIYQGVETVMKTGAGLFIQEHKIRRHYSRAK